MKYVRCDSHCKFPAYDKEEIDNLFYNKTEVEEKIQNAKLEIYPIGSIYMSVNPTSPATLFGGTWEQLKDRFLLGSGDTYASGTTGGEATHTLTIDEMPSHAHKTGIMEVGLGGTDGNESMKVAWQEFHTATSSVGGGQSHNNMPPYLVVYMWKRTA